MTLKNFAYSAFAVVALSAIGVTSASASTIINFDQNNGVNPGGTLNYDGNGGRLVGSGIRFDSIRLIVDGDDNGPSLFCQTCRLNFTTGNSTSESDNQWSFAAGGTFVLTGTAYEQDANGNRTGDPVAGGDFEELVRGSFGDTFVEPSATQEGANSLSFRGSGSDTKDSDLLAFFGIDPNADFSFNNTNISTGDATFDGQGGFSANVTAADVNNELVANNNSVPEPKELGIFGLGLALLLIGVFTRRRNEMS